MASQEQLKGRLQERKEQEGKGQEQGGGGVQDAPRPKSILELIEDPVQQEQFRKALPEGFSPERFSRVTLTAIRQDPKLLKCTSASLLAACMQAAQLGLEPGGVLGHCYLVPFWNDRERRHDVQFILGYKGMIDLALRSPGILSVEARDVCEGDFFEYEYGLEAKLRHKPVRGDRGAEVEYWGLVRYASGGCYYLVVDRSEIERHRLRSEQGRVEKGPWVTDYTVMACKTVLRIMSRYMPVSGALRQGLAADGSVPTEIKPNMADSVDGFIDVAGREDGSAADEPAAGSDGPATEAGEPSPAQEDSSNRAS